MLDRLSNEAWVSLLEPFFDKDDVEYEYFSTLHDTLRSIEWSLAEKDPTYQLLADDIELLIRIAASGRLAARKYDVPAKKVLWFLLIFRHPTIVATIRDTYPTCPPEIRRDMLTLLSSQGGAEAARCMGDLVTAHGLPASNHPRTFTELMRHTEHLGEYVLPMIKQAGHDIGDVVNLVNTAIAREHIDATRLHPLGKLIEEQIDRLMAKARVAEPSVQANWREDEDYFYLRFDLGAWLDLAGTVRSCNDKVIREAGSLLDPWIGLNVISAMLKRERVPDASIVERAARSLETRAQVYSLLSHRPAARELFPEELVTFESFAACNMVDWLLYPAELGYEPPRIELVATIRDDSGDADGVGPCWCLWRFLNDAGNAYAGLSGPYDERAQTDPSPQTVTCDDAFSSFDDWDSKSPEEHAASIMDTVGKWRLDFATRC